MLNSSFKPYTKLANFIAKKVNKIKLSWFVLFALFALAAIMHSLPYPNLPLKLDARASEIEIRLADTTSGTASLFTNNTLIQDLKITGDVDICLEDCDFAEVLPTDKHSAEQKNIHQAFALERVKIHSLSINGGEKIRMGLNRGRFSILVHQTDFPTKIRMEDCQTEIQCEFSGTPPNIIEARGKPNSFLRISGLLQEQDISLTTLNINQLRFDRGPLPGFINTKGLPTSGSIKNGSMQYLGSSRGQPLFNGTELYGNIVGRMNTTINSEGLDVDLLGRTSKLHLRLLDHESNYHISILEYFVKHQTLVIWLGFISMVFTLLNIMKETNEE